MAERYGLTGNFIWANDYPRHEATWPHSVEAIERTMPGPTDTWRAKILGLRCRRIRSYPERSNALQRPTRRGPLPFHQS